MPEPTQDAPTTITLDIDTLTLGEMSRAEIESGVSFERLIAGKATLRLLVMFVHELRSSAKPRSWRELSSLRLSDAISSTSRSISDGASETSKD